MAEQMTVNLVVPPCADGLAAKAADILSEELRLRGIGAQRRTSLSASGAAVMIGLEAVSYTHLPIPRTAMTNPASA